MSILGTLIVTGCGRADDSEEEQKEKLEKQAIVEALQGSWLGACVANPDKNLRAKMIRIHYSFKPTLYIERHYAYDTDDCSGEPLYFLYKGGSFTILEKQNPDAPEAPRQINLRRTSVSLIPNTGEFVSSLTSAEVCGIKDWAIGKPRPVGGAICWGVIAYPKDIRYDVFMTANDGKKLCFGNTVDPLVNGSKASLRPKALGPCYELVSENPT